MNKYKRLTFKRLASYISLVQYKLKHDQYRILLLLHSLKSLWNKFVIYEKLRKYSTYFIWNRAILGVCVRVDFYYWIAILWSVSVKWRLSLFNLEFWNRMFYINKRIIINCKNCNIKNKEIISKNYWHFTERDLKNIGINY